MRMRACGLGVFAALVVFLAPGADARAGMPTSVATCTPSIAHYREGKLVEWLCENTAIDRGLTILDLGDAWTPLGFRPEGSVDGPDYRETYLALSRQDPASITDPRSRELGFFGIFPTFGVVFARLQDTTRQQCHEAVAPLLLDSPGKRLVEESVSMGRARVQIHTRQRAALEQQLRTRSLETLEDYAALGDYQQRQVATLAKREGRTATIRAVQEHLVCEGDTEDVVVDGVLSWRTTRALRIYQRRSFLPPNGWIDAPTLASLQAGDRQEDWRSALRVLRERVVDATGLIEDGSGANQSSLVAGQQLDPLALVWPRGYEPAPMAARDRIGDATDRAARQLGWKDPGGLAQFAERHAARAGSALALRVAVALPALPGYLGDAMELRVEIDLGMQSRARHPRGPATSRRPAFLLFAKDGDGERLLVRWPTTIGGWQDERLDGGRIVERFKPSEVGEFVWKNLYLAPRWLAPESTPHEDVIKRDERGRWTLDREILGPSFRSAYGLAMLVMHRPYRHREETRYADEGIRVHGTGNILSLSQGTSHGCHRLLGYQVIRLSSFLLRHRHYVRVGPDPVRYSRVFATQGRRFPVTLEQRGYRFDLEPPVPVRVHP